MQMISLPLCFTTTQLFQILKSSDYISAALWKMYIFIFHFLSIFILTFTTHKVLKHNEVQ